MEKVLDFILLLLSQFAGGPGPVENNLVRFGLPALLWAVLLNIAWSRQRSQDLPREKLLVWGFGLALVRELYMFGQMAYRLLGRGNVEATCDVIQPLEHGLAMAAMIVVAGAFLNYILDDPKIARRYLQVGIAITVLVFVFTAWTWPRQFAANPQIKFHQTWAAWLFHIPLSILMGVAVFLLWRKRGWLRNVVAGALTLELFSEILLLLNYATARTYNTVICPIGNSLHILAIPLLGYVYLHEQTLEKKKADEALIAYRDHLEELVSQRTAELTSVNTRLKQEVLDRTLAEEALERFTHRYELILESAGEGICGIDVQGRVIFANRAAARMLGYSAAELINRACYSIWHQSKTDNKPHLLQECPIYQCYSQGIQRHGDDEYFWQRDGAGFPVRYFCNPVREKGELAGAVLVFQDITERKRNEAEIARRNASLAMQNAVASTLSQSLEIDENLTNVMEMVRAESEMDIGFIFLMDPESEKLSPYLHSGQPVVDAHQIISMDERAFRQFARQALFRKRTIISGSKNSSAATRITRLEDSRIRRLISVPLISKGRAVGVLALGSLHAISVPTHKLELLTAIGQQIGMAIENARLFKEAENWAAELSRLHEASSYLTASFDLYQVYHEIARQSAWLLRCPKSCVIHLNSQDGQFDLAASFGLNQDEQLAWQEQVPAWEFLTGLADLGRSIPIQDEPLAGRLPERLRKMLDLQAALFVPVWSSEKPGEFIIVMDGSPDRKWQAREMELIESLANRAAVALVNASLHHQLEVAAALEERQRIAADMHDGLAQTLSLLGLRVDEVQELFEAEFDPEFGNHMSAIRQVVANASNEVRRSITSLQEAPRPRSSLQDLIRGLLEQIRTADRPELCFDPGGSAALFVPNDQIEQVLPVVQEAVLNACRHAQPQNISVRLEQADAMIRITIEDDGRGFDPNMPFQSGDHFGLSIMRARAVRIGGEVQIISSPGNGTRIILTWNPDSGEAWIASPLQKKDLVQTGS
jgi:PAS domain S-box-containing protein